MSKTKKLISGRLINRQAIVLSILGVLIYTGCRMYPGIKSGGKNVNINRTWSVHKADIASTGYSPLDQIIRGTSASCR
jgi:hypothetical protein